MQSQPSHRLHIVVCWSADDTQKESIGVRQVFEAHPGRPCSLLRSPHWAWLCTCMCPSCLCRPLWPAARPCCTPSPACNALQQASSFPVSPNWRQKTMMTPSHALRRPDMCSGISGRRPFCNRWKQVRGLKAHQHILLVARPSMGHDIEAAPALLILCQLGLQHLQSFLIHTHQKWSNLYMHNLSTGLFEGCSRDTLTWLEQPGICYATSNDTEVLLHVIATRWSWLCVDGQSCHSVGMIASWPRISCPCPSCTQTVRCCVQPAGFAEAPADEVRELHSHISNAKWFSPQHNHHLISLGVREILYVENKRQSSRTGSHRVVDILDGPGQVPDAWGGKVSLPLGLADVLLLHQSKPWKFKASLQQPFSPMPPASSFVSNWWHQLLSPQNGLGQTDFKPAGRWSSRRSCAGTRSSRPAAGSSACWSWQWAPAHSTRHHSFGLYACPHCSEQGYSLQIWLSGDWMHPDQQSLHFQQ